MAEKTRTYLKEQFESGDTPDAQVFIDLIDSISNFQDDKDFYGIDNNITAQPNGTQIDAYELTNRINVVTTALFSNSSVRLPTGLKGRIYTLYNKQTNNIKIYPPIGGYINNLAVNVGRSVGSYFHLILINYDVNKWECLEVV